MSENVEYEKFVKFCLDYKMIPAFDEAEWEREWLIHWAYENANILDL